MAIRENSIMQTFIEKLNTTKYEDQEQLPNPTMINSPASDGKVVIFTAFLQESVHSKQRSGTNDNIV